MSCSVRISSSVRTFLLVPRGTFVLILSCASVCVAKPQQQLAIPETPDKQSIGKEDAQDARQNLPDAPRSLPLQARTLTFGERVHIYRRSILNPESFVSPALGAAMGQANNEPPEWGQGASGYGTRLASGYGRLVVSRTIRFGVAALDHEDPRHTYTNESGFWRRFGYSSRDYVTARRDEGTRIPAFSRFAGAYGAAFIANTWYPESRANTGHALMRGSTALAAGYAWHVFREFWPDIKNALHHRKGSEDE